MIERWREGYDVVHGVRSSRPGETRFKLATARWFYRLLGGSPRSRSAATPVTSGCSTARALDALALAARAQPLPPRHLGLGRLSPDRGRLRARRRVRRARPSTRCGRCSASPSTPSPRSRTCRCRRRRSSASSFSVVAFLGIPIAIAFRDRRRVRPRRSPRVLLVVLLLGGIQLITVGIIGEYLGRVYEEVKRRPLYVVDDRRNVAAEPADRGAEMRIAVVGAGITGLTAARRLAMAGHAVSVYERWPGLGGQVATARSRRRRR